MSSHATPFELRIFVVNGDPDGLRIAQRSNWVGKALIFPRSLYPEIKSRAEFGETGAYLLLGPNEYGDGELLYIGEGDPVRPRLDHHFSKKDFWTRAVFFVAGMGQLNKAHVQFLEAKLVERAKAAKRVPLENGNEPSEPTLSEADRAVMEVFLENMLSMLPVLGIHAFEQPSQAPTMSPKNTPDFGLLTCIAKSKGVTAKGHETTQGFLVKAGSQAVLSEVAEMSQTHHGYYNLRQSLILIHGVLKKQSSHYVFAQDYTFDSPSAAAAVILGRAANGRIEWRDSNGKTLKELQDLQATM